MLSPVLFSLHGLPSPYAPAHHYALQTSHISADELIPRIDSPAKLSEPSSQSPLLLLLSLQPQLSESTKESPRDAPFVIQMPFITLTAPTSAFLQACTKLEGVDVRDGAYSFS